MKQTYLTLIGLIFLIQGGFSQTFYVKQGGHGNGASWETAMGNLQTALFSARDGEQIWVAKGTYFPTNCQSCNQYERSIAFQVPNGVKVYGGFVGTETTLKERNWKENATILSGNIGREDQLDNSFSVIITNGVSAETIVDGFLIKDGNADLPINQTMETRAGGGWFNDGSENKTSNPTIRNCIFMNNIAYEGGGIFNNGLEGNASPIIENCSFVNNRVVEGGAAIFNNGMNGQSKPMIKNCKFVNGQATYGGAVFFAAIEQDSKPNLMNCKFIKNKASFGGGVFYLIENSQPTVNIENCDFILNEAEEGKDWYFERGKVLPTELKTAASVKQI